MQLSRPSALWCLNWSIITDVPWLMASFANLHLSNIQRVRIEKNRTFFFWIPYIDYFALLSQTIWKWKKKFLPISLLYCLDILTFIKHNPVTWMSYVHYLICPAVACWAYLSGWFWKRRNDKETVNLVIAFYLFVIEKRTNKQTKNKIKQNKQKRKE